MKKLRYGCAIVSFCPDMTSATADSLPLAGLLVGELADEGMPSQAVAAAAWLELPQSVFAADPLAAAIMRDLPSVLRAHVTEAWTSMLDRKGDTESVLAQLHHSLRTTLHVSEISPPTDRVVNEMKEVPGILVTEISSRLADVVRRNLPAVGQERPTGEPDGAEYWKIKKSARPAQQDCHASAV